MEAGSLIAFEAILNEEQRAAFHELRAVTQNDAEDSAINEDTEFDEE